MRLISKVGERWATEENREIFSNVVYVFSDKDVRKYHLIDKDGKDLKVNPFDYLVESDWTQPED